MSYDTSRPHIASYVIVRKEGKIAFVLRSNTSWMNGYYGLPSGKVESEETYTDGAIREAKEEIGITVQPSDLEYLLTTQRLNKRDHAPEWVDVYFEALKWEGEPYNVETDIHSELAWLDPQNLPKNVIPAVRQAIEWIEAGQKYGEIGWQ